MYNRPAHKDNVSGFKGVTFHKNCTLKKYSARIMIDGEAIPLGSFDTSEEAEIAYKIAAKIYQGSYSFK